MSAGAVVFEDQLRVPMDVFELQKFRAWAHSDEFPETGKIAFIDGEIEIDMSPEELNSHNRVKRDISTDLNVLVRHTDLGELLVDGEVRKSNSKSWFEAKPITPQSSGMPPACFAPQSSTADFVSSAGGIRLVETITDC
jgi:hypothetical protein